MVFRQLFDPQSSTYTYLLGDEETQAAVVIDPVKERLEELSVGNIQIEIIETPGHTPDSLSYLVNGRMVFTGDALLIGTCGRTDFQGGDPGVLYDSLHQRLFALDPDVIVYPGHDYQRETQSTIGREKRENSRAAGQTRAEFIDLMNNLNLPRPKKIDLAVPANLRCGLERSE